MPKFFLDTSDNHAIPQKQLETALILRKDAQALSAQEAMLRGWIAKPEAFRARYIHDTDFIHTLQQSLSNAFLNLRHRFVLCSFISFLKNPEQNTTLRAHLSQCLPERVPTLASKNRSDSSDTYTKNILTLLSDANSSTEEKRKRLTNSLICALDNDDDLASAGACRALCILAAGLDKNQCFALLAALFEKLEPSSASIRQPFRQLINRLVAMLDNPQCRGLLPSLILKLQDHDPSQQRLACEAIEALAPKLQDLDCPEFLPLIINLAYSTFQSVQAAAILAIKALVSVLNQTQYNHLWLMLIVKANDKKPDTREKSCKIMACITSRLNKEQRLENLRMLANMLNPAFPSVNTAICQAIDSIAVHLEEAEQHCVIPILLNVVDGKCYKYHEIACKTLIRMLPKLDDEQSQIFFLELSNMLRFGTEFIRLATLHLKQCLTTTELRDRQKQVLYTQLFRLLSQSSNPTLPRFIVELLSMPQMLPYVPKDIPIPKAAPIEVHILKEMTQLHREVTESTVQLRT